jgi:uncharacterized membrane protein
MKKKSYKINKDQRADYFDHKETFNNQNLQGKLVSILPHPVTLESYEEICPGITENLSKMILKEQAHRHKIEIIKIKRINNLYYFGQILTVFLTVIVIYAGFLMMDFYENPYLTGLFTLSAFSFLTLVNYFAIKSNSAQQSQQNKYHNKQRNFKPKS